MPYIVYVHFETRCSDPMIASIIAGSLQLDTADTVEEAQQKTEMYKKRADDFRAQCPLPETDTSRYGYYFWP